VFSRLDDELAKRLGRDAGQVNRWAKGMRVKKLEYGGWEDRGNTVARVFGVYVRRADFTGRAIMKHIPRGYRESDEPGRHMDAWHESPEEFRKRHLVRQIWDPMPLADGGWLIFQDIAGHSLKTTRSLATLLHELRIGAGPSPAEVAEAGAIMVAAALGEWNGTDLPSTRPTAGEHVRNLLGDRLAPGTPFRTWAEKRGLVTGRETAFGLILGTHPASTREIYVRHGRAHGDLHPGNILFGQDLGEYWFIDLSRFDVRSPLAYDVAYLLLTTTAHVLPTLDPDERAHTAALLTGSPAPDRLWLPEPFRLLVRAIQRAGEEWAAKTNVPDEWHVETLLSLVAGGLIMAGRRPVGDPDGEWFLELASTAADRFAELASPSEESPSEAPQAEPMRAESTPAEPGTPVVAAVGRTATPRTAGPDPLPYAVRRTRLLTTLRDRHATRPGSLVTLYGPPGSGKTQLAVSYLHAHAAEYAGTAWLSCEKPALLAEQFSHLAGELGIPPGRDLDTIRPLVAEAMARRGRWLMVLDGAPTAVAVRPFLLWSSQVDVLVTSRSQHWTQLGEVLEVGGFDRQESVSLLTALVGAEQRAQAVVAPIYEGLDELAEALDDLPAAVAQAGHFLYAAPVTVPRFRELVLTRTEETLERGGTDAYGATLAAVWRSALDQLTTEDPAAARLVTLAAFFGPAPVPYDLMAAAVGGRDGEPIDELRLADVTQPATGSGLVSVSGNAMRCYGLLQTFIRQQAAADSAGYRNAVRAALAADDPGDPRAPRSWPRFHLLLPHVLAADLADADGTRERQLLLHAARYLVARGDLDTPLQLVRDAYPRWRTRFGAADEVTMAAMTCLAHIHFQRGEYAEAAALDEEVLAHQRERLGDDSPESLVAARNLASSRAALRRPGATIGTGDPPPSEPIVERHTRLLGPDHPDTLRATVNLAHELRAAGRRHRAREVAGDTHARMVAVLGARHLDTLLCAHGLALDLRDSGDHLAAQRLDEQTYTARRELLGQDHPETAQSALSLATDLRRAGELVRARELDASAHATLLQTLGADHPLTLLAAHGLATDLTRLDDLDDALALAEDTYARRRRVLGAAHLATVRSGTLMIRLHEAAGHPDLAAAVRADLGRPRLTTPA
jgi:tetratricopeptide repeat protein